MTYVEILKAAKHLIASDNYTPPVGNYSKNRYICFAIDEVTKTKGRRKGKRLKDWIDTMLSSHGSLYWWLVDTVGPHVTPELANEHRLLWLDKLIKEYEK